MGDWWELFFDRFFHFEGGGKLPMCFLKEWSLCINLRVAFTAFYFLCVEDGRRSEKEGGRKERVQEDLANKVVTKGLFFSFLFISHLTTFQTLI